MRGGEDRLVGAVGPHAVAPLHLVGVRADSPASTPAYVRRPRTWSRSQPSSSSSSSALCVGDERSRLDGRLAVDLGGQLRRPEVRVDDPVDVAAELEPEPDVALGGRVDHAARLRHADGDYQPQARRYASTRKRTTVTGRASGNGECGWRDSNPHGLGPPVSETGASTCFRHIRMASPEARRPTRHPAGAVTAGRVAGPRAAPCDGHRGRSPVPAGAAASGADARAARGAGADAGASLSPLFVRKGVRRPGLPLGSRPAAEQAAPPRCKRGVLPEELHPRGSMRTGGVEPPQPRRRLYRPRGSPAPSVRTELARVGFEPTVSSS